MTVDVRPVADALGVELRGIDLREEQPDDVRALAVEQWREHHLVLVRGQELDAADQLRFARWFGPISDAAAVETDGPHGYISNTRPEGVARSGALLKHQDYCFFDTLLPGLCLYAEEAPAVGGETIFASAERAHAHLPAELASRIAPLQARHVYDPREDEGDRRFRVAAAPEAPTAVHPVALRHPLTGRTVLFVNELMTDSIVDLPEDESEALLHELWGYLDDPSVTYRHRWEPGDVIVWDNISLQHGRTDIPPGERRSLRRLQVGLH